MFPTIEEFEMPKIAKFFKKKKEKMKDKEVEIEKEEAEVEEQYELPDLSFLKQATKKIKKMAESVRLSISLSISLLK